MYKKFFIVIIISLCFVFVWVDDLSLAIELPKDIVWLTNDKDPEYSSEDAVKGGIYNTFIESFPPTFRVVGPDSNSSFRSFILDNQWSLVGIHPNTENLIPQIATHWAFGKDGKTMYFKINPKARWSDGTKVSADDFLYTLEFMRSKYIVAPWYNDFYTKEIDKVIKYDDYTIAVVSTKKQPDLHLYCNLAPTPRHYYHKNLGPDFVTKYNWAVVPNTGPYQITKFEKGKFIEFSRKKDWWAKDLRYYRNRFNVDKVVIKVIRDINVAWEYFKKGQIDSFLITFPELWHDKSKGPEFDNGYIHKLWFYTDTPQPSMGLWINQDQEILKDINVRLGLSYAINMDKVLNTILRGDYQRLPQHYTGYGKYTNANIKARPFDLEKANKYFKLAGWDKKGPDGIRVKDGKRLSFTITYGIDLHTPRLVILKEEAKKAGVELKLQLLDSTSSFKKILEKKHELAWMAWSVGLRPVFWQHYHSDNAHKIQTNNITNTDDKELDKLIDRYREETSEQKRIKLSHVIQDKLHQKAVFIPAYMVPYFREAYWRWWKLPKIAATKWSDSAFFDRGFSAESGGLFWFDERLKKETLEAKKKKQKFMPVQIIDTTFQRK